MKKFAGLMIDDIAKKTKTPVLIFDADLIATNYRRFIKSFSKYYPSKIYFSVKTNNEKAVLKKLRTLGSSAQVSSGMEMYLCEQVGYSYNQMILDGPAKKVEDLDIAFRKGIYSYNADSFEDIIKANEIGRKLKRKVNIGLRINCGVSGHLAKSVEFYISKFGVNPKDAISMIADINRLSFINFVGLHTHIGSQVLSVNPFLKAIDILTELASNFQKRGISIEYIDFGGGIPSQSLIRYSPRQVILKNFAGFEFSPKVKSIEYYGESISKRLKQNIDKHGLNKIEIIFEPGRSIVSNAGIVIAKVLSVKDKWIFINASITFIPENVFFTERNISAVKEGRYHKKYHIAGCSLLTPDFFSRSKRLPVIKAGDLLVIEDCGAYTMSRSSQFTTMRPPIFMIEKKKLRMIRKEDNYESFIGPMVD